jgi:uncharacterized membrane protein (UPF0136 family)
MFGLIWVAIGMLIGYSAAKRKGFSVVGGIFGGALLGFAAPLMYLVSGITKGDERKKCPACAEWVALEAKVCKHCGREIAPTVQTVAGV